jgi:hypothetical protein
MRVPVADVEAAFENDDLAHSAQHICASTWFCSRRDFHPNNTGYGVIAQAHAKVVPHLIAIRRGYVVHRRLATNGRRDRFRRRGAEESDHVSTLFMCRHSEWLPLLSPDLSRTCSF